MSIVLRPSRFGGQVGNILMKLSVAAAAAAAAAASAADSPPLVPRPDHQHLQRHVLQSLPTLALRQFASQQHRLHLCPQCLLRNSLPSLHRPSLLQILSRRGKTPTVP